jgi:hypothetical protein
LNEEEQGDEIMQKLVDDSSTVTKKVIDTLLMRASNPTQDMKKRQKRKYLKYLRCSGGPTPESIDLAVKSKYHKPHTTHGWSHCCKNPAVQNSHSSNPRNHSNEESHKIQESQELPEDSSGIINDDEELYEMDTVLDESTQSDDLGSDHPLKFQPSDLHVAHRNQKIVENNGKSVDIQAEDFVPEVLCLAYKSIMSREKRAFHSLLNTGISQAFLLKAVYGMLYMCATNPIPQVVGHGM